MNNSEYKILETHRVPKEIQSRRLSEYCRDIFSSIPSRKGVKKAIKRKLILVNGKPSETGFWIRGGEEITVINKVEKGKVLEINLKVVYEDQYLAAIIKPGDLSVSGNRFRTVKNALPFNLKESDCKDALPVPLPVHRLDRMTSGLLLIAKTRGSQKALGTMFENRKIHKTYFAVVQGAVAGKGIIEEPIDLKEAVTSYTCMHQWEDHQFGMLSCVEVRPLTGRTNQIRRHFKSIGHPVLGDQKFGGDRSGRGLYLFAHALEFVHPITEEEIHLNLDIPKKLSALKQKNAYPGG